MADGELETQQGPRLEVEVLGCRPGSEAGQWRAAWRIWNRGDEPASVLAAWHPHGKFRGAQNVIEPPISVQPGDYGGLQTAVRCTEPPGSEIENAFLVLRVADGAQERWRVFARLRVSIAEDSVPEPRVEVITTQRVGFSRSSGVLEAGT